MTKQEVPKISRVVISPELRERVNEICATEHRNITNAIEVLLLEALDARQRRAS